MRLDWKYLLGLPLDDPGFDHPCWEFRAKVARAGLERAALDALLERLEAEHRLLGADRKQQRPTSAPVTAAVGGAEPAGADRGERPRRAGGHRRRASRLAGGHGARRRVGPPLWGPAHGLAPAVLEEFTGPELAVAYARDGFALLEPSTACSTRRPRRGCGNCPRWRPCAWCCSRNFTPAVHADGRGVVERRRRRLRATVYLHPGHQRIASPWDADARWGVKKRRGLARVASST